jgi:GTP-binding protein LepA
MVDIAHIRNFCIIAHIDHGKSTLADRLIQKSAVIDERNFQDQILDTMDIERERGITIKSQAITIPYQAQNGQYYELNLVDTPGHVDFSYEVSRAISSCEGALLVIDATQGVQSQTLSNMYLALEHNLELIPVINKIDMQSADIAATKAQIDHDLGLDSNTALLVSARNGTGIDEVFEALINRIPPPQGDLNAPLRALIFDCHYDSYRGVIVHIRIFDGMLKPGMKIHLFASGADYIVETVGTFNISLVEKKELGTGTVGYFIASIKTVSDVHVGDTVTYSDNPCAEMLTGFREVRPVVFSSIYPLDSNDYEELKASLEKLKLNDASLIYEKDSSAALGFGFRCGFLGLLHLEIIQERLEREFNQAVIFTAPSVQYHLSLKTGESLFIDNPADYPDEQLIEMAEEPYIKASIISPTTFLGNIISLCVEKRGVQVAMTYLDEKRVELIYDIPLAEVLFDFYDRLKSISRGYASFDYELTGYKPAEIVKLDILLNGKAVDALAQLVWKEGAYSKARQICKRLCDEIPRQQFKIPIQGTVGSHIIARETVQAFRKDVLAKCYGGDITRKRKLLEKQKEGKKRMKMVGDVELPQSAFLAVLKTKET